MSAGGLNREQLRLLTLAAALFASALMLLMTVVPVSNNDVWILMKVGELIVDTGRIPDQVLFAFTTVRDNHFNAHEWLPSVVFHELDILLGLKNLIWVPGAFALVQFWLCVSLARRQSGSLGAALLLALLAMAGANARYVLRPELFALLFLVLLLVVLDRYRREGGWKILLWTLPLTILWVNSHGSFLLAPVIAGLFALGEAITAAWAAEGATAERLRTGWRVGVPYAIAALAMTAACTLNPAGWHILAFPFQLQRSSAVKLLIFEWLPTFSAQFVHSCQFAFFVATGLVFLAVVVKLWRHLRATDAMLFALFLGLALERNRHTVWLGFVALYVCARLVAHLTIERRDEIRLRVAAAVLSVVGLAACTIYGNANGAHIFYAPSDNFGPAIVRELADPKMKGNVWNSYELGGELIYRDWPRLRPSIDSRVDSYGDDYLLFSIRLLHDERLLDLFLDGNQVAYMLLLRRDFENNVRNMPSIRANWHIRLTDGDVFLLERNQPLPTTGTAP